MKYKFLRSIGLSDRCKKPLCTYASKILFFSPDILLLSAIPDVRLQAGRNVRGLETLNMYATMGLLSFINTI